LVIAKSKLPSIKTKTTMPKLEMNALTLATRLALSISQAVKKKAPGYPWKVYIFSDSQIVLNWLSSTRCTNLGVLVSNRLQEMRRIRYGSFSTVKRITALVLRFLKHLMRSFSNARKKAIFERIPELNDIALNSDPLNGQEMRAARFALIRNHQLIYLTSHYRKSMENTLRLYKDTYGIWRSRGRIGRSTLDDSAKNPVFIAPNTALARRIIQEAHGTYHCGVEHTIAEVRQQYWIPKLRQQVRKISTHCVKCRRFNALPAPRPAQDARLAAALAIIMFPLQIPSSASSCQQLNILEHHSTVCRTTNGMKVCSIVLSEVMKISTFKQEACLRLTHNSTLAANVKIRWKGLYLRCNQETMYFTRSADLKVLTSKRCPHMGSCSGLKCAAVNSSSLIPELEEANRYPGRTGCLESCGGPGCDCFYLSSGCLFFRVFATPKTRKIYEIFRCVRWTEQVKLEVEIENGNGRRGKQHFVVQTIPNVPVELPQFKITLTSLSLPPTPALASTFITDGIDTAIWKTRLSPVLHCGSRSKAQAMNCTLHDKCKCTGAESTVNCDCAPLNIEEEFAQISLKVPVKTAFWELTRSNSTSVIAKIPHLVSAEIILNLNHSTMESLRELFEAREEVQRLRHMYYMKKHELEDARKNLAEVSNELKKLRRALPPLPDPDRLYVNTIDRCHEFHACTKKMTQLEERIRALARSTEDLDVRLHELSLLEVTADKLRLEFLFVRCQLRTLFAAPELLFATGKISENVWDAWMSNPQFNDDGKPLLMKPNVIETAIADQL
uniref:Integrase_H2C2 domain-containing protein n=1 Tax=Heligmosomoides polygyrus TaxID=6339 RepID=A0A183F5L8_HELPZ